MFTRKSKSYRVFCRAAQWSGRQPGHTVTGGTAILPTTFLYSQSISSSWDFLNYTQSAEATVKLGMAYFPDTIRPVDWETWKYLSLLEESDLSQALTLKWIPNRSHSCLKFQVLSYSFAEVCLSAVIKKGKHWNKPLTSVIISGTRKKGEPRR